MLGKLLFFMAPDDEFVEELDIPEEGGGKGGSKLLILILLVNTLLIAAAIVYFFFFYEGKQAAIEEGDEAEETVVENTTEKTGVDLGTGPIVELEQFVVNLDDVTSSKYLKVQVAVELSSVEAEPELLNKKLVARDQILVFLSSLKVTDTVGIEGKASIKEGIINRLNHILLKGNVKNVYFKSFVVQ